MSDLISRQAILKHIEKKQQNALMIDDIRESSIIMWGMNLLGKAVRNQPSAQLSDDYNRRVVADRQYRCPVCGAPVEGEKCEYCGCVIYDFKRDGITAREKRRIE